MAVAKGAKSKDCISVAVKTTRQADDFWLIGHPCQTITGAKLPSGRDVMRNFMHFHRSQKLQIDKSANLVYEQLLPFWEKSRLPTRQKNHTIKKIKDLFNEHAKLMKNRSRSNEKDQLNQKEYSDKLDTLFDISHANAYQLITNEEDKQFLKLQQESRTGSIGSVDKKLAQREMHRAERQAQLARRAAAAATTSVSHPETYTSSSSDEGIQGENVQQKDSDSGDEFIIPIHYTRSGEKKRRLTSIMSPKVSAVLDRTKTSTRKSAMIIASVLNEAGTSTGCSTSTSVLSKSTIHRQRQKMRQEIAQKIKANYQVFKSVVHWDGKLILNSTGEGDSMVERLPVLLTTLTDGKTKLLGVPKLGASSTGQKIVDNVIEQLQTWECDNNIIGMCFDTTSVNTGKFNGACTLLENKLKRDLLWLACRHHMLEVLLADAFTECFGNTGGPEIGIFKRFKNNWSKLNHREPRQLAPLIIAPETLRTFITKQLQEKKIREDYQELLRLSAVAVGLKVQVMIRKPGALHKARWMAKAIYSLKMELLFDGNEDVLQLTAREIQGLQRFNRFVVLVYIQSWYTCRFAADAPVNDILLIQRLGKYDDLKLCTIGLNMMKRHSWYLSPELATLALFSTLLPNDEKTRLVENMIKERGTHLLKSLPKSYADLKVSHAFFYTTGINSNFLEIPVEKWPETQSFKDAKHLVHNLACVNDVAERGVALIQTFNDSTKNEDQKQFLLQVVEKHRKDFAKGNRSDLINM